MLFICSMIEIKENRHHRAKMSPFISPVRRVDRWVNGWLGLSWPRVYWRGCHMPVCAILSGLQISFSFHRWVCVCVCERVWNDKGASVCAFIRVLFTDKNNRMLQFGLNYSFVMWLCFICIEDITPTDQTNGVCVCVFYVCVRPHSRVLPRERAPKGEPEMLPAAPVWSYSSWWSGKPLDAVEVTGHVTMITSVSLSRLAGWMCLETVSRWQHIYSFQLNC